MSRTSIKRFRVKVQRMAHAEGLALPTYQSIDAAGLDLVAALPADAPLTIKPRGRAQVPTGLRFELPRGTEGQVRPRSGLAHNHGVTVLNAPGTIDADYRGEVMVLLINLGDKPFSIRRGERIAQLVVQPVARATLIEVEALTETRRGAGGFGSTGVASAKGTVRQPAPGRRPIAAKKSKRISTARRNENTRGVRGR